MLLRLHRHLGPPALTPCSAPRVVHADEDAIRVVVYVAITGKPLARYSSHQDLIYDLQWSHDDRCLVTASSDYSARVWELAPGQVERYRGEFGPKRVLLHPTFAYSACFHPRDSDLVFTGAYDGVLRLWDCANGQVGSDRNTTTAQGVGWEGGAFTPLARAMQVLLSLSLGRGYLNSICLEAAGRKMFVGDSAGLLHELGLEDQTKPAAAEMSTPGGLRRLGVGSRGVDRSTLMVRHLRTCNDLQGEPICHVSWVDASRRLLVVTKHSRVVLVDATLMAVDLQLLGCRQGPGRDPMQLRAQADSAPRSNRCEKLPLQPVASPDGQFVLCGSEDGKTCVWDADTGELFQLPHLGIGDETVLSLDWSFTDHLVAACSITPNAPVKLFAFDSARPPVLLPRQRPPRGKGEAEAEDTRLQRIRQKKNKDRFQVGWPIDRRLAVCTGLGWERGAGARGGTHSRWLQRKLATCPCSAPRSRAGSSGCRTC